jgi:hypothetical protein
MLSNCSNSFISSNLLHSISTSKFLQIHLFCFISVLLFLIISKFFPFYTCILCNLCLRFLLSTQLQLSSHFIWKQNVSRHSPLLITLSWWLLLLSRWITTHYRYWSMSLFIDLLFSPVSLLVLLIHLLVFVFDFFWLSFPHFAKFL